MYENSNKRLLFLPPSVKKGKESAPRCEDFICEDSRSLGQGAFGEVFRVRHKLSGKEFAIKVIPKQKIIERRMLSQLRREIRIMYSLSHPNIISLYSHFEDSSNFYLILELAHGQLYKKLKKLKNFNEQAAAQVMREVTLAVQYLHSRIPAVIHRDIKPENILLDKDGMAKLGDFGWSNFFDEERETYCGTLEYLAPEMIERKGHGVSLDIWTLGVLLFELLTGTSPFRSRSQEEIFSKIKQGKVVFPKSFPLLAKDLIKRLVQVDPEKRLTAEMILEHSWILSHAPLRPTAELVKCKVELPNIPDEGDVDFTDSDYFIISAPVVASPVRNNANPNKINLEIALKGEEIKRISVRIEKLRHNNFELDLKIKDLQEKLNEQHKLEQAIQISYKRNQEMKHKNSSIYKRLIKKCSEIKILQKKRSIFDKKIWKIRNDSSINSTKLNLLKSCYNNYTKINCFKSLKLFTDELSYSIILLNKAFTSQEYFQKAKWQLESLRKKLNNETDIEKFIPEFKRFFATKSKSVKHLSLKLKDLKSASVLQSQIIKTFRSK